MRHENWSRAKSRIALSEEDEKRIARHIASGRFDSPGEVFAAGLELLEAFHSRTEEWLSAEIPARLVQYRGNPEDVLELDDLFAELEALNRKDIHVEVRG